MAGRDYLIDRFLDALSIELARFRERRSSPVTLDTLYFGGGTPSHLDEFRLERLGQMVAECFTLSDGAEVTAECNPNDLSQSRLQALVAIGVNRISLGVQSFECQKLKRLERDHTAAEIFEAVALARPLMRSISIDLIFAAPEETLPQWSAELEQAISLRPDHLSTYELTYEKGTQFWNRLKRGALTTADEDLRADMYQLAINRLGAAGWKQYELSSFALPGHRSRHNQVYWSGADYLAFGPGASRFVGGVRETNHRGTIQYMRLLETGGDPVDDRETLTGLEAARERLVIGLRRIEGVVFAELEQQTGFELQQILGEAGQRLVELRLLELLDDRIKLTPRGVMVSDGVATEILGQVV